jgi:beta-glucosidase
MARFRIFGLPTDEVSQREAEHRLLAREAAAEGIVLLKNDGVLPIKDEKIALFGIGARKTVKGGSGGGEVHERYSVNIEQGLLNAGYKIENTAWMDRYDSHYDQVRAEWKQDVEEKIKGFSPFQVVKMFDVIHANPFRCPASIRILPEELDACETAIYVIGRQAGENFDRKLVKGDWYLDDNEVADIRLLAGHYKKLLVVINCGGLVDLSPLDDIDNIGGIMHFVQGGEEGGNAFADLVSGKITPSGRLVDTWAMKYEDYPSADTFGSVDGNPEKTVYKEGIYVGYRWFDAFGIKPRYPFGFGLSYTQFAWKSKTITREGTEISVDITVINKGKEYSGKETLQLYVAKPQGRLSKERFSLAAFEKTRELKPGESQPVTLSFDFKDCASYDEDSASWILEAGEYGIFVGNSCVNHKPVAVIELDETAVVEILTNICPVKEEFEEVNTVVENMHYPAELPRLNLSAASIPTRTVDYIQPGVNAKTDKVQSCLDTFTDNELIEVCVGAGYSQKVYNHASGCAGKTSVNLLKHGIPNINMADGPSGLYLMPKNAYTKRGSPRYVDELPEKWQWGWLKKIQPFVLAKPGKGLRAFHYMTAFPAPVLQAQSWNIELVERIGHAIGREMLESGITFWLAPGLNIHRNPLCGRNFEYYSEDPLISGKMAAAVTRGVQSFEGIGVCLKHICCNNQEDRREYMTSDVHERALREIYLRGFSIAVKEAQPWSVMSSYNMVNSVYTPNSHDLLTKVLRNEWGFDGLVMTDWNSTEEDKGDHELCLPSGNDLIMPGSAVAKKAIKEGLKKGTITKEDLRRSAANILNLILESAVIKSDKNLQLCKKKKHTKTVEKSKI